MARGVVKKLVPDRGFGFIRPEGNQTDLFFHATAVQGVSFEDLREGQGVEFEVERDPRRGSDRAVNIRLAERGAA